MRNIYKYIVCVMVASTLFYLFAFLFFDQRMTRCGMRGREEKKERERQKKGQLLLTIYVVVNNFLREEKYEKMDKKKECVREGS